MASLAKMMSHYWDRILNRPALQTVLCNCRNLGIKSFARWEEIMLSCGEKRLAGKNDLPEKSMSLAFFQSVFPAHELRDARGKNRAQRRGFK